MKLILPIIMALFGTAMGIGFGKYFLGPSRSADLEVMENNLNDQVAENKSSKATDSLPADGYSYVKLNNQFVVPIMDEDRVRALVIVSLSIEVPNGKAESIYEREPKLRDVFLQAMFDHANIGGFEGQFTEAARMIILRDSLREVAQTVLGKDVKSVLITEIARQDT